MNLLKSCYTHVVIKTFGKLWIPSLLMDSFLSTLFIQSCNQISKLNNRDESCCCALTRVLWVTSSRDSCLMALRASSVSPWPPHSNYRSLGRSIPDLFIFLPPLHECVAIAVCLSISLLHHGLLMRQGTVCLSYWPRSKASLV